MHIARLSSVNATAVGETILPCGTETVLVVIHESAQREYAAWILRERGYKVIEATNGQEALCLFHNSPNRRIDLVLADAVMPRLCGKALAHKIAAFLPKSRMLITSHYPAELAIHNDLLDAELNYLQKPATRTALALKVREVLDNAEVEELQFTPATELETVTVA